MTGVHRAGAGQTKRLKHMAQDQEVDGLNPSSSNLFSPCAGLCT